MSDHAASRVPRVNGLRRRRTERLRREIALLSEMDQGLWRKSLLCGLALVGGLSALLGAAAAKLSYLGHEPTLVLASCVMAAALLWWLGRYSLWLPALLAAAALAVILEDIPDLSDLGGDQAKDHKAERRAKIAQAVEKRRALLARLESS